MRRRQAFAEQARQAANKVLSAEHAQQLKDIAKYDDEEVIACEACKKTFKSAHGLKVHNAMVHK